jgi:hypothetical protein
VRQARCGENSTVARDPAGGADAYRGDVVPARERVDDLGDHRLGCADIAARCVTALEVDDPAGVIDHPTGHLRAADVDSDGQRHAVSSAYLLYTAPPPGASSPAAPPRSSGASAPGPS